MKLTIEQLHEKVIAVSKILDGLTIDEARNILAETRIQIEECHFVNSNKVEEYILSLQNSANEHLS